MAVVVATDSLYVPYVVIDSVVAVGGSSDGFFSGPDASGAFAEAKQSLRVQALALGGNAVINCDLEVRNYSGGVNVVAFGTVVFFDDQSRQERSHVYTCVVNGLTPPM